MPPDTHSSDLLAALRSSVRQLRKLTEGLDDAGLARPSYAADWTVADALSHIGSGAVIMGEHLRAVTSGETTDPAFAASVWEDWDAKSPSTQADDALTADDQLLEAIASTDPARHDALEVVMGPMRLGFDDFVAMRLNEHALHTWDVAVADHPDVTLNADAVPFVIDNLGLVAQHGATPNGRRESIEIAANDPERRLRVDLAGDTASLGTSSSTSAADLILPAEAFIRLLYGRLDPEHTPDGIGGASSTESLRTLRQTYRGV